jgi:phosphoribosylanthranilate isomerase
MTTRVRVKICGLTRAADVEAAASAGADAIGFVCYAGSPRFVPTRRLRELRRALPPFITPVLLFVNASDAEIAAALDEVPDALLQFHGDETEADCLRQRRPYLRAAAVREGIALLDFESLFPSAQGLLADTPSPGRGGAGKAFDWRLVPPSSQRRLPLVLAGGLDESNVAAAIARVRPQAVDVSSGVELEKGIKDPARIARFIAAVRAAESNL